MSTPETTNRLIHENSPYLLQHAHNPVDWYPWGDEALHKAVCENKLILVSIGYSACHWCHVMAHESFEDREVAKLMNEHFVCIKVDREERPDIDHLYMEAVILMNGNGGWPLNCFALPTGKPVYGGTYFRKENWKEILIALANLQAKESIRLVEQSEQIESAILQSNLFTHKVETSQNKFDVEPIGLQIQSQIDRINGGLRGAPKFPMPAVFEFLFAFHFRLKADDALKLTLLTIDKMADGGLYDQLGGGFSRYSTDDRWFAPHFEKMLYDNAQLVSLYSHAFQITKNSKYKLIIDETLEFVLSELYSPIGGFYSALDADSEGSEGKYYSWSYDELKGILGKHFPLFADVYGVTNEGNWEDTNILYRSETNGFYEERFRLNSHEFEQILAECRAKLVQIRNNRIRPGLDHKIIASWNGLMLKAFADAYKATGKLQYLETAVKSADFMLSNLFDGEKLLRTYNDKYKTEGFLEDYASIINSLVAVFEISLNEEYILKARELTEYTLAHFFDHQSGMFFFQVVTSPVIITRKIVWEDNVIPSSNSIMAENLFLLASYFGETRYRARAEQMIVQVEPYFARYTSHCANWLRLAMLYGNTSKELVATGTACKEPWKKILQEYLPGIILAASDKEGQLPIFKNRFGLGATLFYICENNTCKLPVSDLTEALNNLKNRL